jgi:hypothetical protein
MLKKEPAYKNAGAKIPYYGVETKFEVRSLSLRSDEV